MSLSRQLLALVLTTDNSKQTQKYTKTQKVTLLTVSIYNKQMQENTKHTKPLVSKSASEKGGD